MGHPGEERAHHGRYKPRPDTRLILNVRSWSNDCGTPCSTPRVVGNWPNARRVGSRVGELPLLARLRADHIHTLSHHNCGGQSNNNHCRCYCQDSRKRGPPALRFPSAIQSRLGGSGLADLRHDFPIFQHPPQDCAARSGGGYGGLNIIFNAMRTCSKPQPVLPSAQFRNE